MLDVQQDDLSDLCHLYWALCIDHLSFHHRTLQRNKALAICHNLIHNDDGQADEDDIH